MAHLAPTPGLHPVWADLHIHTVVSPCAEVEMIPPLIIRRAQALGLGVIAITDHNTTENVSAVWRAARETDLTVLPGMEVQTREEAHILCLFDQVEQALRWQEVVYAHLPPLRNREETFGAQYVVDETGELVRVNERLLLTATRLTVEQVVEGVRAEGGLPIAAHVDRPAFRLLRSLGFVPEGLALAGLEITARTTPEEAVAQFPDLARWPLILSGDAHRLSEMRASTLLTIHHPCIRELELALAGREQRKVRIVP